METLVEVGGSVWYPVSWLNYCEDGFIELRCQITTEGSADKDFIIEKLF